MATTPKIELPAATGYASTTSLYATRYQQGGRTVYGLHLSLDQIADLIDKPDPDKLSPGNRMIRPKHAEDFGKYLREREDWVSPGMILRSSSIFEFEPFEIGSVIEGAAFGILVFPAKKASDIFTLDGQHRILGIHLAKMDIRDHIDNARSELATARRVDPKGRSVTDARKKIADLEARQDVFAKERISVEIMILEDPQAYKQAFFDIADNALGITASVKSMFDSRKVVNRSLETVFRHPILNGRVDIQRDRIPRNSEFLLGSAHVQEIVRTATVGFGGRVSRIMESTLNEKFVAQKATDALDALQEAFPIFQELVDGLITPEGIRKKSLLGSVLMLRVLVGAYYELAVDREWDRETVVAYLSKLAPHMGAPVYDGSIWTEHTDLFDEGAMAPRSRRQDLQKLVETLVDWALADPAWLSAPPAPRPEEAQSTEEEMRVVDEILARR